MGVAFYGTAMLMTRSLFTTIVLTLAADAWTQTLSFSRADYPASPAPRGIVAADFDRDGAIDLAMVNTGRDSVSVLINATGAGKGFVQAHDIVLGGGPFDLAASDLNRDHVLDLVVANADLNTIDVILGRTAGGFEPPVHIPAAGNPRGVAVADLDGDGHEDIVYTQFYLNSVQVLHGDGAGNFTARIAALPVGERPQGVIVGHFAHCCRRDIAVANTGASELTLLQQTDMSVFQRVDVPGPQSLNVLTSGDFNRDGRLDIAAVSTANNRVVWYRGSFTALTHYDSQLTGSSPRGIAAADLNQDGFLDVVTANRGANNVSIRLGRTDAPGWFGAPVNVAAGAGSRDVALADFNNDGQVDIATANEYGNSTTVLTNSLRPPGSLFWEARALPPSGTHIGFIALGDFNRNARVDIVRPNGVLLDGTTFVPLSSGESGPLSVADATVGDFNTDGTLDVAMLTIRSGTHPIRGFVALHFGDGAGGFRHAGNFGTFGYATRMEGEDLNNDGRLDLAVIDTENGGSRAQVLLGTGTGFLPQVTTGLPSFTVDLDLADFNRDGKIDLITAAAYWSAAVQVFHGDGAGRFSPAQALAPPGDIYEVEAMDVNHDGLIDVLAGGDTSLAVWLGSATGTFGTARTYGSAWGTHSLVVADFTGDGHLDVLVGHGYLQRGRGDGSFADPEPVNLEWHAGEAVDYDRDGRMDVVVESWYHTFVLFSRAARGPNIAPVADVGPAWSYSYDAQFDTENECGGSIGRSYDPNLDALTYEWRDREGRIVSTEATPCLRGLNPGTYTFTLIVRDGHGGEASDTLSVTVHPFKEPVTHLSHANVPHGSWRVEFDTTAAEEFRLWHPNAGAPKLTTALAQPTHYVDTHFLADPTQTYKLWVRLKAENDYWGNDSIFVQFGEGAVIASGATRYRIGTTDALDINLEQCSGCGISGWGWRDERWGSALNAAPILLRFPQGGWQWLRIQTREDGVSIDQIVLSSEQYLNAPPGPAKNDNTILPQRPSPGG